MRVWGPVLAGAAALLLVSCNLVKETPAHHAVHKGEQAVLSPRLEGPVWLGVDRGSSEDVTRAYESGDRGALGALERSHRAFSVDKGSRVEVLEESFNDRKIRILSAAHNGETGWVPFEWLQPLPKSDQ